MLERGGFLDGSKDVSPPHLGAGGDGSRKVPLALPVQGGNLHPTGQVVGPSALGDLLQGTLDAVINHLDQARPQFHRQGRPCGLHRRARAQAGGLLVHLDGGRVPGHGQHLADEALLPHPDHVRHVGLGQACGHHQGARNFHHFAVSHRYASLLSRKGPSKALFFLALRRLPLRGLPGCPPPRPAPRRR